MVFLKTNVRMERQLLKTGLTELDFAPGLHTGALLQETRTSPSVSQ